MQQIKGKRLLLSITSIYFLLIIVLQVHAAQGDACTLLGSQIDKLEDQIPALGDNAAAYYSQFFRAVIKNKASYENEYPNAIARMLTIAEENDIPIPSDLLALPEVKQAMQVEPVDVKAINLESLEKAFLAYTEKSPNEKEGVSVRILSILEHSDVINKNEKMADLYKEIQSLPQLTDQQRQDIAIAFQMAANSLEITNPMSDLVPTDQQKVQLTNPFIIPQITNLPVPLEGVLLSPDNSEVVKDLREEQGSDSDADKLALPASAAEPKIIVDFGNYKEAIQNIPEINLKSILESLQGKSDEEVSRDNLEKSLNAQITAFMDRVGEVMSGASVNGEKPLVFPGWFIENDAKGVPMLIATFVDETNTLFSSFQRTFSIKDGRLIGYRDQIEVPESLRGKKLGIGTFGAELTEAFFKKADVERTEFRGAEDGMYVWANPKYNNRFADGSFIEQKFGEWLETKGIAKPVITDNSNPVLYDAVLKQNELTFKEFTQWLTNIQPVPVNAIRYYKDLTESPVEILPVQIPEEVSVEEIKETISINFADAVENERLEIAQPDQFVVSGAQTLFQEEEGVDIITAPKEWLLTQEDILGGLSAMEIAAGVRIADPTRPLMVDVKAETAVLLPAPEIKNFGLTDTVVLAMPNQLEAQKMYADMFESYAPTVGIPSERMQEAKQGLNVDDAAQLEELVFRYKQLYREFGKNDFVDAIESGSRTAVLSELTNIIKSMYESWNTPHMQFLRQRHEASLAKSEGLVVRVQQVNNVFKNAEGTKGTLIASIAQLPKVRPWLNTTALTAPALKESYVVFDKAETRSIAELEKVFAEQVKQLAVAAKRIAARRGVEEVVFAIEDGKLQVTNSYPAPLTTEPKTGAARAGKASVKVQSKGNDEFIVYWSNDALFARNKQPDQMAIYVDCLADGNLIVKQVKLPASVDQYPVSVPFTCGSWKRVDVIASFKDDLERTEYDHTIQTFNQATTCQPALSALGGDGMLRNYANPCCQGAGACCSGYSFNQGASVPQASSQGTCYQTTAVLGGPPSGSCLSNMQTCDVTSANSISGSSIYSQFGWSASGVSCSSPINPFTSTLTSSAQCAPIVRGCTDGQIRRSGLGRGTCEETVLTCVGGTWTTTQQGRGPTSEICDGRDNDCDGMIDEHIMCTGCTPGASQPCTESSSAQSTCVEQGGSTVLVQTACRDAFNEEEDQRDKNLANGVSVAKTAQAQYAIQTQDGIGIPCVGDAAYCVTFNNQLPGPTRVTQTKPQKNQITGKAVYDKEHLESYAITNCEGGRVEMAVAIPPSTDLEVVYGGRSITVAASPRPVVSGFDPQELADKGVIPFVSHLEIKEGTILSPLDNELQAYGATIRFEGDINGVPVSLQPSEVTIRNRGVALIGRPLELFIGEPRNIGVRISVPISAQIDAKTVGFYLLKNGDWSYVGGVTEGNLFTISIDDIAQYLDTFGKLTFTIAGSPCNGCKRAYLQIVRDVQSPLLVVLMHGFLSDPQTGNAALLREFEAENMNVDLALFGYAGLSPKDAAAALGEQLRLTDYEKIVFIAHSYGGLVAREFIKIEEQKSNSLIPKIEALIMAGVPNKGTEFITSTKTVFDLSAKLFGLENAPLALHPDTIQVLQTGLDYKLPRSIKGFVLIGTRDLYNIGKSFGVPVPNDMFVSAESVRSVGPDQYENTCENAVTQYVDHIAINKGFEQRYTLLYFLRQLSSEFREKAPAKLYAVMQLPDCTRGTLDIYGYPIEAKELPVPEGCESAKCGDGVCQVGEVCERDCAYKTCPIPVTGVNILAVLTLLTVLAFGIGRKAYFMTSLAYSMLGVMAAVLVAQFVWCGLIIPLPVIVFMVTLIVFVGLIRREAK